MFVYWGIILIWVVLGGISVKYPTFVAYNLWPAIVLFIILGLKVLGAPH